MPPPVVHVFVFDFSFNSCESCTNSTLKIYLIKFFNLERMCVCLNNTLNEYFLLLADPPSFLTVGLERVPFKNIVPQCLLIVES